MLPKRKPVRSAKLRMSAFNRECTTRIPGHCNGDPKTSVLAHPPVANGGMGLKGSDSDGAICCSGCHDVIDDRVKHSVPQGELYECWIRGAQETRRIWIEEGLMTVKGAA